MLKNKLILFLFLFINTANCFAQNWNKKYVSSGNDFANSIIELNGFIYINITNDAICKLIKTDLNGNIISQTKFDNFFRTSTLLATKENTIIVIGNDIVDRGIVILKIDENFNQIWATRFRFSGYNFAESAILNSNGDITVCGYSSPDPNSTANRDALIIRVNNSGQKIWSRSITNTETDYFSGICEGSNGDMVLTGAFQGGAGLMDIIVYKINSEGNTLYVKLFGGGQNDGGYSVDYLNNNYYLSGNSWSTGAGEQDIILLKFDDNMNLIFSKSYGGENIEPGLYITHDLDGNLILLGQTNSITGKERDLCLLLLNNNGNILKMKNIGGNGDEAVAFGYKVIVNVNNRYYITCGSKSNSVDYDALLYQTDFTLNDNCCNTLQDLSFINDVANLTVNNINFTISSTSNIYTFTIQKSNIGLSASDLCNNTNSISVALEASNTIECKNMPIEFSSLISNPSATVLWDFGDPTSGILNNSNTTQTNHKYKNAGNYFVTLIATDGCVSDTDTITINIKESINIQTTINTPSNIYCINESVQFNSVSNDINANYRWNFNDTSSGNLNLSTQNNPTHQFNKAGQYFVQLVSFNECEMDTDLISINIIGGTNADFVFAIDSCFGSVELINTSEEFATNAYNWTINSINYSNNKNITYQILNDGEYTFQLIQNPNTNCPDTISKKINYSKLDNSYLLLIPNIFSPNGDGINDQFIITGNIKCNLKNIIIFNRWGEQVYSSYSTFEWDGKHNGREMNSGSYVIYLEYSDEKIVRVFNLIR